MQWDFFFSFSLIRIQLFLFFEHNLLLNAHECDDQMPMCNDNYYD